MTSKFRALCTLIAAIFLSSVSAQNLVVIQNKDKFGYADETGREVIKPKYTHAYPFENGLAKVCSGEKWGYINEKGKAVIPIVYDNIEPFENGIARVKKGKKYGYIKDDGSIYITPDYDFIGTFNDNGWLWVGKGKTLKDSQKGLYQYNKLILKPSAMNTFFGFYVKTDSADYTDGRPIHTKDGVPVANEITQNFCRISSPDAPYIWAFGFGYTTIYDLDGKALIKRQAGAFGMPKNGQSIRRSLSTKKDKQYYDFNYISADGKATKLFKKDIRQELDLDNIYSSCMSFNDGRALCGNEKTAYIINPQGEKISAVYERLEPVEGLGYISRRDNLYGFVTLDGRENSAPKYNLVLQPFEKSGVFPARNGSGMFGFVNFQGQQVVPFQYEDASAFVDGKGYVKKDGFFGIVDSEGNFIVKNKWSNILPASSGIDFAWVQVPASGKWQCLQISKDARSFDTEFDNVYPFDAKGRALVQTDPKIGAVATDGSIVLPFRFNNVTLAAAAINQLDKDGKTSMTDAEAYRFNIYNNSDRHKYRLHQTIEDSMWDF